MRSIKKIHRAEYSPIGDLITYRALPTESIGYLDPFLFLNHHGPQQYSHDNHGLPFGPHPHRGMITVTLILEGDIVHKDSSGNESVINAGGVQWMTAGKGLIHEEVSSEKFKKNGGTLEILQLWVNLPARLKMTEPFYKGLQKEEIPVVKLDDDKVQVQLISGDWLEKKAAFKSEIGVHLSILYFKVCGSLTLKIPKENNIFFYIIKGRLTVNEVDVPAFRLVEFNNDEEELIISSKVDSVLFFGHSKPLNEPIIARGPFVMNTEEEITEAYADYNNGKFGTWD